MSFCLLPTGSEDGLEFYVDLVNQSQERIKDWLATPDGEVDFLPVGNDWPIMNIVFVQEGMMYGMGHFIPDDTSADQLEAFLSDFERLSIVIDNENALPGTKDDIQIHPLWSVISNWVR